MRLKKITVAWLIGKKSCESGIKLFKNQSITDPIKILKLLMKKEKYADANWLIVRLMTYRERVSYAVFAAEQVIDYYEKKYPDCNAPRNAINAARKCIKTPSKKNKIDALIACAAAAAVSAAAFAASAAVSAAAFAVSAAVSAAASAAASAASAAADSAAGTAYAASDAACMNYASASYSYAVYIKILKYGIKLIEGGK